MRKMVKILLKPQPDPETAERLAQKLNLSKTVAALLLERGFGDECDARRFLSAGTEEMTDPFRLSGMREAAAAVGSAIGAGKKIVIFGDYDCDGIGAVAILYLALKKLGADVGYFIPERKYDGYGISWSAMTRLFEKVQADLIVSVDCGISSYREIERAKAEFGADFVVTDHHELPEILPDAILVNPHFGSETEFSGAGVALKLAEALIGREAALEYADICCLSTVADIVPLKGENRILVKEGLRRFEKRAIRPGLKELLRVAGIDGNAKVTSYDIGFKLAPRINASGRLDSAQKSIELLIGEDASELRLIAESLNEDNLLRQKKTEEVVIGAKEKLKRYDIANNHAIFLWDQAWDAGVLGIAASRIAEAYRRPTILMTDQDGCLTGSARSVPGIDLYDMLRSASKFLIKFGGHAAAAGLTLKPENLSDLAECARNYLHDKTDRIAALNAAYADFAVTGDEGVLFYKDLERLEPYGMGNPKPLVKLEASVRWTRINSKPHLKSVLNQEAEAIAFSKGELLECLNLGGGSYVFLPEVSVYRNRARASLMFRHYEAGAAVVSEETLLVRYLRGNLAKSTGSNIGKREPNAKFGKLYVAYTEKKYRELQLQHSDYYAFQMRSDTSAPDNAIVLSPDEKTDFTPFNEIVFAERPPERFLKYVDNMSAAAVRVEGDAPQFAKIDLTIERLRALYILFFRRLNGKILTSTAELWSETFESDCKKLEFELSYAIFEETGLLSVDSRGIITVINKKTDLNQSAILRSLKC